MTEDKLKNEKNVKNSHFPEKCLQKLKKFNKQSCHKLRKTKQKIS